MIQLTNKALFADTLGEFMKIRECNDFSQEMVERSQKCGFYPGEQEIKSWKENFNALKMLFSNSQLPDDVVIAFEYQLPIGGRIDCMLFGKDKLDHANIIHIELKQWSNENVEICYDGYLFSTYVDVAGYRGEPKHSSHPSAQAEEYQIHMENYITALIERNISLSGLAYCYNYDSRIEPNALCSNRYKELTNRCPLFCKNQTKDLANKLNELLAGGGGFGIFKDFCNSEVRPTTRLQDAAKKMFDGKFAEKTFALVGEQLNAYNEILGAIDNTDKENEKTVIIVKGGPGTGKSVIAMQLIAGLAKTGRYPNIVYSTRSTSLIAGYQEILKGVNYKDGKDNRAIDLITKNSRIKPIVGENGIDALIVDEAHRIENKSNDMNDKDASVKTHLSQIMNMLFCSRVSVFFIDDLQAVKSIEIGTSEKIKEAAVHYYNRIIEENRDYVNNIYPTLDEKIEKKNQIITQYEQTGNQEKKLDAEKEKKALMKEKEYGLKWVETATPKIQKVNIVEIELKDQFRCNGSNNYIDWIEHVLFKTERTKNVKLDLSQYVFGVYNTPQELYAKIRSLDDFAQYSDLVKKEKGDLFSYKSLCKETNNMEFKQTARLVAGWCWEWKQKENESNGDLKHEITIPEFGFSMPWETLKQGGRKAKNDFRYKYAPNQDIWILDKRGVNQVGCNHSAQGWETDYIGVIIANDLKYDPINDCLYGDETVKNYDKNVKQQQPYFTQITKNIYRVLLTRGKKGCFIFCCDPKVGEYFKRCMEQ